MVILHMVEFHLTDIASVLIIVDYHCAHLSQGQWLSILIHSEGALWGWVSERCEMRWKRVQHGKEQQRWLTHSQKKTQTQRSTETHYLNREWKKKSYTHEKTNGGKGLCNTVKSHRSNLIIHMTVGVADDH